MPQQYLSDEEKKVVMVPESRGSPAKLGVSTSDRLKHVEAH